MAGTCTNFYAAFGTTLQGGGQTAAQAMANCISCQGTGCPDNSRVSEFYILEANINKMKTIVSAWKLSHRSRVDHSTGTVIHQRKCRRRAAGLQQYIRNVVDHWDENVPSRSK